MTPCTARRKRLAARKIMQNDTNRALLCSCQDAALSMPLLLLPPLSKRVPQPPRSRVCAERNGTRETQMCLNVSVLRRVTAALHSLPCKKEKCTASCTAGLRKCTAVRSILTSLRRKVLRRPRGLASEPRKKKGCGRPAHTKTLLRKISVEPKINRVGELSRYHSPHSAAMIAISHARGGGLY